MRLRRKIGGSFKQGRCALMNIVDYLLVIRLLPGWGGSGQLWSLGHNRIPNIVISVHFLVISIVLVSRTCVRFTGRPTCHS